MTQFDWVIIIMTALTALLIPAIGLMFRLVIKWTKTESRLEELTKDMRELVNDKDKIHSEILGQMRDDRAATDKRLRWLEENVWRTGRGRHAIQEREKG